MKKNYTQRDLENLPMEKRLELIETLSARIASYPPQVIRNAKIGGERGKSEIGRALNNPLNYYGAMMASNAIRNQNKKDNKVSGNSKER